jgi:hypothetical protein
MSAAIVIESVAPEGCGKAVVSVLAFPVHVPQKLVHSSGGGISMSVGGVPVWEGLKPAAAVPVGIAPASTRAGSTRSKEYRGAGMVDPLFDKTSSFD